MLHVRLDPRIAHVVLEQRSKRAVVIRIGEAAVNLGAGKDKAPALAQSDQFLQVVQGSAPRLRRDGHGAQRVTKSVTSVVLSAPDRACTDEARLGSLRSHL